VMTPDRLLFPILPALILERSIWVLVWLKFGGMGDTYAKFPSFSVTRGDPWLYFYGWCMHASCGSVDDSLYSGIL
jgi:hypothetical protein